MMELKWAGGTPADATVRLDVLGVGSVQLNRTHTELVKVLADGTERRFKPDLDASGQAFMIWPLTDHDPVLQLFLSWAAEDPGKNTHDYDARVTVTDTATRQRLPAALGSSNPADEPKTLDANFTGNGNLPIKIA